MPLSPRRVPTSLGVCDDWGDVLCCSLSTVGERQNSANGSAKRTRYSVPSRSGTPMRMWDEWVDVSCCFSSPAGTFSDSANGYKRMKGVDVCLRPSRRVGRIGVCDD